MGTLENKQRRASIEFFTSCNVIVCYWFRIRNTSIMNILLVAITIICALTSTVSALKCYSCEGQKNDACLVNPTSVKVITCSPYQQCYITRKEKIGILGSSISIKRGCGQSVGAAASSGGGYGASASSVSCSTDLCNFGDGRQNFNINDFINNFNIPNFPGGFINNPSYPVANPPGNNIYGNNNGFSGNYPFYPNYFYGANRPNPFYNIIASALNNQWQNNRPVRY